MNSMEKAPKNKLSSTFTSVGTSITLFQPVASSPEGIKLPIFGSTRTRTPPSKSAQEIQRQITKLQNPSNSSPKQNKDFHKQVLSGTTPPRRRTRTPPSRVTQTATDGIEQTETMPKSLNTHSSQSRLTRTPPGRKHKDTYITDSLNPLRKSPRKLPRKSKKSVQNTSNITTVSTNLRPLIRTRQTTSSSEEKSVSFASSPSTNGQTKSLSESTNEQTLTVSLLSGSQFMKDENGSQDVVLHLVEELETNGTVVAQLYRSSCRRRWKRNVGGMVVVSCIYFICLSLLNGWLFLPKPHYPLF